MRKTSFRFFFFCSAFGLLFGGLVAVRVTLAVFLGVLDGKAVLPRILDARGLLANLFSSLAAAGLWSFLTFRGKKRRKANLSHEVKDR